MLAFGKNFNQIQMNIFLNYNKKTNIRFRQKPLYHKIIISIFADFCSFFLNIEKSDKNVEKLTPEHIKYICYQMLLIMFMITVDFLPKILCTYTKNNA